MSRISASSAGGRCSGGSTAAESPEWMPASSMCWRMPQTTAPLAVGEQVEVELDGVLEEAVEQHRMAVGAPRPPERMKCAERLLVVADRHGAAAEHVGRAHQHREADAARDGERLVERARGAVLGLADALLGEQRAEALAVLGEVDRVGRGAQIGTPAACEPAGELERRLAAELARCTPSGRSRSIDRQHVLERQRLEVEAVGGVVVGRDGLRIAVDHDRLEARASPSAKAACTQQ